MKYFESHPIVEYNFSENYSTISLLDIFRTNFIEIDDILKKDYVIKENDNTINISDLSFDSPFYHWVLELSNNIINKNGEPELLSEKIINFLNSNKRKKCYFFIQNINAKPGDILIKKEDLNAFNSTEDPYAIVLEHDPLLRKTTIIEPEGSTLAENNVVLLLRKNTEQTNFELIDPPGSNGITLDKNIEWANSVLYFENFQNPYTNVSGSGVTFFSSSVEGITFTKTLLFSYITDGISHYNYDIETEISKMKQTNNTTIKIPNLNTLNDIENAMRVAFSIKNSSRVWTLNVLQSRIEL